MARLPRRRLTDNEVGRESFFHSKEGGNWLECSFGGSLESLSIVSHSADVHWQLRKLIHWSFSRRTHFTGRALVSHHFSIPRSFPMDLTLLLSVILRVGRKASLIRRFSPFQETLQKLQLLTKCSVLPSCESLFL